MVTVTDDKENSPQLLFQRFSCAFRWLFDEIGCQIYASVGFIFGIGVIWSLFLLILDRYLMICDQDFREPTPYVPILVLCRERSSIYAISKRSYVLGDRLTVEDVRVITLLWRKTIN